MGAKNVKTQLFKICFYLPNFKKFIVCMWTARCPTVKNTQKVYIYGLFKSHNFQKGYRFWKSYTASSWDEIMHVSGRWPQGHTIHSKFSPFCNQTFASTLHTSGLKAKVWNFNNAVFMRKQNPENVCELPNLWFKSARRKFIEIRPEMKHTEGNKR